jgi:hypothetical protein
MKIYIPKDEEINLFSIIRSSSGFVIPLVNFNFINHHLTICKKEIGFLTGINIHITEDNTDNQIYNEYFEVNISEMEKVIVSKFLELSKKIEKDLIKKIEDKTNFRCVDCYFDQKYKTVNFSKKNQIKKYFNELSEIDEYEQISELKSFNICNNSKHKMILEINENQYYRTFLGYIIKFDEQDLIFNKFFELFKIEFKEFFEDIERIIEDIKLIVNSETK